MKKIIILLTILCLLTVLFSACSSGTTSASDSLPLSNPDGDSMFGVDKNVNINTIDNYLGRDDVAYVDVRMLFDSADFAAIGGDADLSRTIQGFKVVPYPFIATLSQLPVSGAYSGQCLYSLTWDENGGIASVTPNYAESDMILNELFPKDKAIFLMCGGGGYSALMKSLLVCLGWDEQLIYNIGANWNYSGKNTLELTIYPEDANGDKIYATWRADYAYIDFSRLHRVTE